MPEQPPEISPFPPVGEAESGQKLLAFLVRRLDLPQALLHRWLRTGQIRLNGRRCKPFIAVQTGDLVRVPPFARKLAASVNTNMPEYAGGVGLPPLLAQWNGIWAFNKPAGMPVQGGTGQADSICGRLRARYSQLAFCPAPAHRLDRDTSGILLVGSTFPALQKLQADFRSGRIHKEYLAWVEGRWPWPEQKFLRHFLSRGDRIIAYDSPAPGRKPGECMAVPVAYAAGMTLLHIRLLTGRKRQLRAQLAACGHPIAGDARYGHKGLLKLHSCRIIMPDGGPEITCLPSWDEPFSVSELPPPIHIRPQQASST